MVLRRVSAGHREKTAVMFMSYARSLIEWGVTEQLLVFDVTGKNIMQEQVV